VAQLRAHGQLGFGAFGRAMEEIHAEELEECGEIGEGHGRSSAAADVLIAWPMPTASRMRARGYLQTPGSMRSAGEGGCRARLATRSRHDALVVEQSPSGIQRCYSLERAAALVAQLDRAPDFESGGRGFESLRARQIHTGIYETSAPRGRMPQLAEG